MNKKRFLAVLAAATLLVSAVPVYAADPVEVTGEAVSTQTGTGEIEDFEKDEVYKVTLPTDNALNFIVDPQNLTSIASGESMEVDINATGSGVIFSNGIAAIKNESNVDVIVTVNLTATAPDEVTLLETQTDWDEESKENEMFLVAVPGVEKVTIASGDAVENYVATGTAVAIQTENPNTLSFKLNKATYVVTNNNGSFEYGIADDENNYDAVAFKIGGVVNKNADWKQFKEEGLTISAVFDIAKATGEEELVEGLYNVVDEGTTTEYTPAVADAAGAAKEMTVTYGTSTYLKTVGEDKFDVSDESKVKVTVNGKDVAVSDVSETKITVKKTAITAALGGTAAADGDELTFVVTDASGAKYKFVYVVD